MVIILVLLQLLRSLYLCDGLAYEADGWKIHQFNLNDRTDVITHFLSPDNITIDDLPYVAKAKTLLDWNAKTNQFAFVRKPLEGFYRFGKIMYTRTDDACFSCSDGEVAAPFGIAAIADWVITDFRSRLAIFGATLSPQIIYVQERALMRFVNEVLPHLTIPFVLICATNDNTIPENYDLRYNAKNNWYEWYKVMNSSLVLHFHVENLSVKHPRASTVPIGTWNREISNLPDMGTTLSFANKTLNYLVSDKVHNQHPQMRDRIIVAVACLQAPGCHHIRQDKSSNSNQFFGLSDLKPWIQAVETNAFHLCVHGGGFDPSTKAWETMLIGSIPIIEHSTLDDAYRQLPVVYLRNLTDFVLNWKNATQLMEQWSRKLAAYYTPERKHEHGMLLERLQIFHWFRQMLKPFDIAPLKKVIPKNPRRPNYLYGYLHGLSPELLWQFWKTHEIYRVPSTLAIM